MNVWMDIAIPALVFAAGCLAVAIGALWERRRMKMRLEDALDDYTTCTIARGNFKSSLEACQGELADAIIARDKYKLQLDEALKAKPARTPRAKKTEANNGE